MFPQMNCIFKCSRYVHDDCILDFFTFLHCVILMFPQMNPILSAADTFTMTVFLFHDFFTFLHCVISNELDLGEADSLIALFLFHDGNDQSSAALSMD